MVEGAGGDPDYQPPYPSPPQAPGKLVDRRGLSHSSLPQFRSNPETPGTSGREYSKRTSSFQEMMDDLSQVVRMLWKCHALLRIERG